MLVRSVRAAIACVVVGCGACAAPPPLEVTPPPPYQQGPELNSGSFDWYLTPGVTFRAGSGDFWGGGWGPIEPGPVRKWPH